MVYRMHAPGRGRYGRLLVLAALLSIWVAHADRGRTINETADRFPAAAAPAPMAGGSATPTGAISYSSAAEHVLARHREPLATPDYGVFSSVVMPIGGLEVLERRHRLIPDGTARASLLSCAAAGLGAGFGKCRPVMLDMARQSGIDADAPLTRETLDRVNRGVNRFIAYGTDVQVHGRPDHWASIDEILALRRGDCEDYAIAKMWLLAALGMPLERMQLVVLYDTRRHLHHAVLVVHHNGGRYVLDNTTDRMVSQERIRTYLPIYSLAAGKAYLHDFGLAGAAAASTHSQNGKDFPAPNW